MLQFTRNSKNQKCKNNNTLIDSNNTNYYKLLKDTRDLSKCVFKISHQCHSQGNSTSLKSIIGVPWPREKETSPDRSLV